MRIEDLNNILKEYNKHFGNEKMSEYFKSIIKYKKEKENAISEKKSNNSSRSNK
jgi:hypothetical protein